MNKQENLKLAKLIWNQIKRSNSFQLVKEWKLAHNRLENFHQWARKKHCYCAYLIRDESTEYWFLFINWQPERHPNRYYVVIYPENRSSALAEIHAISEQGDAPEFEWKYRPTKQDSNNDLRRDRFKKLEGTLDVRIVRCQSNNNIPPC